MIAREINSKVVFLNRNIEVDNLSPREFDVKNTIVIDKDLMPI